MDISKTFGRGFYLSIMVKEKRTVKMDTKTNFGVYNLRNCDLIHYRKRKLEFKYILCTLDTLLWEDVTRTGFFAYFVYNIDILCDSRILIILKEVHRKAN